MYTPDPSGWAVHVQSRPPKTLRGIRLPVTHARDSRYGSIFRRRTTSLFAPPEGSASLGGHTLAPAAPGSAAAHRTPPHSPTSQRRLVPSPELSPESRRIRNRMRVKGQESKFRTPQQRGELDMHLPQKKRGEHKRSQRRNGPNRGRVRRHPRPRAHLHDLVTFAWFAFLSSRLSTYNTSILFSPMVHLGAARGRRRGPSIYILRDLAPQSFPPSTPDRPGICFYRRSRRQGVSWAPTLPA